MRRLSPLTFAAYGSVILLGILIAVLLTSGPSTSGREPEWQEPYGGCKEASQPGNEGTLGWQECKDHGRLPE